MIFNLRRRIEGLEIEIRNLNGLRKEAREREFKLEDRLSETNKRLELFLQYSDLAIVFESDYKVINTK